MWRRDQLVLGRAHPGPKHWDELASQEGKFHVNSLHRDERPKTEGMGGKNVVLGGISLSKARWLLSQVPEANPLIKHFFHLEVASHPG